MFEDWDEFFMGLAFYVAMKSEDTSTHSGAVIVNDFNRAVSFGYNGLPTGVLNTQDKNTRPGKYLYYEHSERNAIYNAEKIEPGCRIYVNFFPCTDCARGIIQKRIKEVIYHPGFTAIGDADGGHAWSKEETASRDTFTEAGVKITPYFGKITSHIVDLKAARHMSYDKSW